MTLLHTGRMEDAEVLTDLVNEPEGLVTGRTYTGSLPQAATMSGHELEHCTLRACRWEGEQLQGAVFGECEFVGCNLSGASLEEVSFRECLFTGTKALGLNWTAARVSTLAATPMTWRDCSLDFSTLSTLTMAGWTFQRCSLRETQLVGADLRRAVFTDCDLSGATIADCDLRGAALIDCVGLALDARDNRVDGLEVSASMAADLLRPFGVVVR